jgi:ferric-dicitrate binding protein FerR (iron transport regulator)
MKRSICQRAWEAEAVEDGRVDARTRASFERHAASCDVCTRERAALKRLVAIVEGMHAGEASELQRRRARTGLMKTAHFGARGDAAPTTSWRTLIATLVTIIIVVAWSYRNVRFGAPTEGALVGHHQVEVEPKGIAQWSIDNGLDPARMTLRDGTVSVHVSKLVRPQRFVLTMPDGEIEVHGTRFVVTVAMASTRRVEVTEGAVALRLLAQSERILQAGDVWIAEDPAPPVVTNDTATAATPALGEVAVTSHARPSQPKVAAPHQPTAGSLFDSAMRAYESGDFDGADQRFEEFTSRFPSDARCEDAALIGILIRSKRGDRTGARQRAHQYLAKYPAGLHQAEVERFLR